MPETVWNLIRDSKDDPNNEELFKKAYEATHKSAEPSMAKDELRHHRNYDKFIKLLKKSR
jgi:hypothetical protein